MNNQIDSHDTVKEYYGKILKSSKDLKTSCCTSDALPNYLRAILPKLSGELLDKFYGCGSPIPLALEGMNILDLGCGSGRDVYLMSYLAGESGRVVGIDMTPEQLNIAKKHSASQTKSFGFSNPNVEFIEGYIEDLVEIPSGSVDVVTSNCVINLSPDKPRVFSEIFRVLKPGGEIYFSDIFSNRRIPFALREDSVLRGECLTGALYIEDFRRILRQLGSLDYRVVSKTKVDLIQSDIAERLRTYEFYSMTVRAFKLESLEDICEDYGQVATYQGTLSHSPLEFILDDHHRFLTGKPHLVCGNTAAMLSETRFSSHFKIEGNRSVHYGAFPCAPEVENQAENADRPCC